MEQNKVDLKFKFLISKVEFSSSRNLQLVVEATEYYWLAVKRFKTSTDQHDNIMMTQESLQGLKMLVAAAPPV
jgi:hypothetical protein